MSLTDSTLSLTEPAEPRGLRLPIDFFFRSLAAAHHERAICIVLSGTGSDGTLGAARRQGRRRYGDGAVAGKRASTTACRAAPSPPAWSTMSGPPLDAEAADCLRRAMRSLAARKSCPPAEMAMSSATAVCPAARPHRPRFLAVQGHDACPRRMERRMALHQIEHAASTCAILRENPSELEALFRDLLIGVTNFFRDPGGLRGAAGEGDSRLWPRKPARHPVRVWVLRLLHRRGSLLPGHLLQNAWSG